MTTRIEVPKEGFVAVLQYKQQSVYFFRYDIEETEDETVKASEVTIKLKGATYASMVSALIGVKYSTDAQIALLYNYQSKPEEYAEAMSDYQDWRFYCKEAAREFFGIELTLDDVKERKVAELMKYDASPAVNSFTYQGVEMWLDKATRSGLLMRLTAEQAAGKTTTTLWYGTESFELPIEQGFQLLYALEVYASQAYDRTAAHKAAVEALTSVEEVEAYDFRKFYPEKLVFEIEELK